MARPVRRFLYPQDGWLFLTALNITAVVAVYVLSVIGAVQQRSILVALYGASLAGYFALLAICTYRKYRRCYPRASSSESGT